MVEEVKCRDSLAATQEQVTDRRARSLVDERHLRSTAAQFDHFPERLRRLFVQRHHALFQCFACWDAQPRGPVWIAIKTVEREPAYLAASCSRPPGSEQRCTLERTRQRPNRLHEFCELICWNEAWHSLREPRQFAGVQHRPRRETIPTPCCTIGKDT